MFVCIDCAQDYWVEYDNGNVRKFKDHQGMGFISNGLCEDCHKQGPCYEIPSGHYIHRDSPMAKHRGLKWD